MLPVLQNGVWSRRKCSPFVLCARSLVPSQTPYRLISRFFLNLRAICYLDQITTMNQTAVSTMSSPIRTHPFWRQPRRLTATFSYGFGTEASTNGDLATQTERSIPYADPVDLDTRQDSDKDNIRLEDFSTGQK